MDYYMCLIHDTKLESYRGEYDKKQIGQFCAYYARRLTDSVLKYVKGQRKNVIFYPDHIQDFYPHFTEKQVDGLLNAAYDALGCILDSCVSCSQRCLDDYGSRSGNFELYEDNDNR